MKLGAHLSISGGLHNALFRAKDIGANCLQIFSSSPRIWQDPDLTEDEINLFVKTKLKTKIDPVYFHATYLLNLAETGRIAELSKASLIEELRVAKLLGIKGSVIHLGSFKENTQDLGRYQALFNNIQHVLDNTPVETLFIIENAGNRKIGLTISEIGFIIKNLNNKRVRVCLDTCHLHASGYDLSDVAKLTEFIDEFDKEVGYEKLELFHMNDSKDERESNRDRHENIGEGKIGMDTFQQLLNHPATKFFPFIIEVPGFDGKGPDKKNLDILKKL